MIDPTWLWEFRTGNSYSGEGEVKAVTWIVVAKDHYGHHSGVTLMSEEIIGKYCFENREGVLALMKTGLNHWEDSSSNTQGERLRSWLNATGIHSSSAFCQAFSNNFKQAVLITNLPNKDWKNGNVYRTWDRVFIPSTTELGDPVHRNTHRIGSIYPYYREANNANRTAKAGSRNWWYWTRSPNTDNSRCVCNIDNDGAFRIDYASCSDIGVRPALNLKADTLVSKL